MGRARDLGGDPPRRRADHRFLPARRARSAPRRRPRDRRRAARAGGVPQRARPHAVDLRRRHARVPAARLPGRVLHLAAEAGEGGAAAVPRAAAVLDVAARAHGRVGRPAAARRHPQQPLPLARPHRRADTDDLQPLRRLRGDGARAAAVHGAAALRGDEGHFADVRARRVVARRAAAHRVPCASTCRRRCPASAPAA